MDIFIARTFKKAGDKAIQLFDERVFDTYNKALAYLEKDFFDKEDSFSDGYYGEIISHFNDDKEIISDCYNVCGHLTCKRQLHPAPEHQPICVTPDFVPRYKEGDRVAVSSLYSLEEYIGVICAVPPTWSEIPHVEEIQNLSEEMRNTLHSKFEAAYQVGWISDSGILRHSHVYEQEMTPFEGSLPGNLEFLELLAAHHRGKALISKRKLDNIYRNNIFLFPVKTLRDIGVHLPSIAGRYIVSEMYSPDKIAVYEAGVGLLLMDSSSGKETLLHRLHHFADLEDIRLYCRAPYICAVENRGTAGLVINAETGETHPISRGDYHVENCSFPIGFTEREGETLLIHATDWNRLDITRLSDFSLLTSRELTKENGIDYFHSELTVSSDGKHFAVDGWIWSPMESIEIYNLERFFTEYDKASVVLDSPEHLSGYNWDRPLCWVDEKTVAVGHHPNEGTKNDPPEISRILLYDISEIKVMERFYREEATGEVKSFGKFDYYPQSDDIPFDGFCVDNENEVWGKLFYDRACNCFIGLNNVTGLLIADRKGNVIFRDPEWATWKYSPEFRVFFRLTTLPFKAEIKSIDELVN